MVNAAIAKIGPVTGADLRTQTKAVTQDLLGKLPDAGQVYLEQMMFAAYCTALRDDRTLKEQEKAQRLKAYISEVRKTIQQRKGGASLSASPTAPPVVANEARKKGLVSDFTASTMQMKEAARMIGDIAEAEVVSAINAGAITVSAHPVKRPSAPLLRSLDAMVAHAQSIEQIVDAGNKGAVSAKQVADSVKKLVDAVEVDPLTESSVMLVQRSMDTRVFVYTEYTMHVTAKSLLDALEKFDPSVAVISELVQAQVVDARRLFVELIEAQVQGLASGGHRGYGTWLKRKMELAEKQMSATSQLLALTPSATPSDHAKADGLKATLAQLELAQRQIASYLEEYKESLKRIRQREKVGLSILGAVERAIIEWGVAHQQLAKAVKARKPVNVDSLLAAVVEAKALGRKWHESGTSQQ